MASISPWKLFSELVFLGALGEMRGVFGVHLAILAAKFGLLVVGELAGPGKYEGGGFGLNDLRAASSE